MSKTLRDSLVDRLRTLRPRLDDPRLARRVDAWIAPEQ
jgi:predicted metal-dependent hydrolase